jgi:SAM-dependent methyltransferase
VFFERVLGVMFDLPFADASFDYVYCCEVLHHNDSRSLRATMREIHRVLRPGGRLLVINEELRGLRNRKPDHGADVAEYEGHENAFFLPRYWLAAKAAGFDVSVREPQYHRYFAGEPYELRPHMTAGESLRAALLNASRRSPIGRRLYLAYRNLIAADVALNMDCVKRR